MELDFRKTDRYREAQEFYERLRRPGRKEVSDAADLEASPDGSALVFSGTAVARLDDVFETRICRLDLSDKSIAVLTSGPNSDRMPRYSPDGRKIAFLSDRRRRGDFQLYLFDIGSATVQSTPPVEGWVEYLRWSPDGARILLGVAGHGAERSGAQGGKASGRVTVVLPSWMPQVEGYEAPQYAWRSAWLFELSTGEMRHIRTCRFNIWEAAWCGNDAITAVVSSAPDEGSWYQAHLRFFNIDDGYSREICLPKHQIGWPASSPSGANVAIVEAFCSDRGLVAGDLILIAMSSGETRKVETNGIDITYTEWRSDTRLLLAGHRGFETVVGSYDAKSGVFTEIWSSCLITTGGRYATVAGMLGDNDFVLVGEHFNQAPQIAAIREGRYQPLVSLALAPDALAFNFLAEPLSWRAQDGLIIQGWLLRPKSQGPFPLITVVHGGPVWHWRPTWLGRSSAQVAMLLERGYACFFPNPRGSAGRGQEFAIHVLGDMGGADASDITAGIDHLVREGIADSARLGVTGASYGGFMSSWLTTLDRRFVAAVSVAPITNHVTQHLLSNIPNFSRLFLDDTYTNIGGDYFRKSPVLHANRIKTPTLLVCGLLDRSTPPEEAIQLHKALSDSGVESVLLTYPEEGHGIRQFPACIDYAARMVYWFDKHLAQ